ncbi:MAG: hypothetical protein K6F73_07690 [Lachnospiraceae bacterium]|nr:hypothetical protein [Lachnospiraceae bacterium]
MKGIKKLFLGLVFMTLFCVGFKIEAKAVTPYLDIKEKTATSYKASDFSKEKATFVAYVEVQDDEYGTDFPDIVPVEPTHAGTVIFTYNYTIYDDTNGGDPFEVGSGSFQLISTRNAAGAVAKSVKVNGRGVKLAADGMYTINDAVTRELVRADLATIDASLDSVTGGYIFKLEAVTDYGTFDPGEINNDVDGTALESTSVDVTGYRVYGGAYCGTEAAGVDVIYDNDKKKVLDEDGFYMFNNESKTFSVDTTGAAATNPSYSFIGWTTDGGLTIAGKKSTYNLKIAADSVNLDALFGSLEFTPNITPKEIKVKAGDDTDPVGYEFLGYDPESSAAVAGVYVDGAKLAASSYSWAGNEFTFTVPSNASEGTHTLTIKMNSDNGGFEHTRQFSVDNGESIDLNSTVAVTYKMTIPVNKFVSPSDSTKTVTAEVTSDAASYAKLRKKGSTSNVKKIDNESVADILLYGDAASGGTDKSSFRLTYNGATDTAKVTVFPWPDLILNTSSSSSDSSLNSSSSSSTSSATSPFKVVMPAGVYHDNYMWSDVKKAKLVFSTSDKSKEATLDISSTDKYTRSATVNSLAVTSILNDICTESSQDVKVTVYPMNGSDYDRNIDDSETITAYKITLDGSGGAKYTVNGTEMKDYFYAVKGTTYTIKSTSGNGEKFTRWEGVDFSGESGGTITPSGSMTLKSIYGGSSSSSSSSSKNGAAGDNADDYDDVPKTGESKADIWILWSVLLISILGAGFMIYKRFGLVRAIAEADEEVAIAEHRERAEAEKKEEENKMNMLKSLRNLK